MRASVGSTEASNTQAAGRSAFWAGMVPGALAAPAASGAGRVAQDDSGGLSRHGRVSKVWRVGQAYCIPLSRIRDDWSNLGLASGLSVESKAARPIPLPAQVSTTASIEQSGRRGVRQRDPVGQPGGGSPG